MENRRGFIGMLLDYLGCGITAQAVTPPKLQPISGAKIKEIFPVRIWKLGSLEHRIYPTQAAIDNLTKIISAWDKKSPLDIIWGPELQLEVHYLTADGIDAIALNPEVRIVKSEDVINFESPTK